jgi:dTDP-4-dehydrorhamnose reductase
MKILLTGAAGQLGHALREPLAPLGDVFSLTHEDLDLANADAISQVMAVIKPRVIVNAAAYTAVDQAETDSTSAFAVNASGPAALSQEALRLGALLVHFSTDYVFDGEKQSAYVETDDPRPLNTYGHSKLGGERAVRASGCRHLILRTSWVYSERGKNFLRTMLRLAAEKDRLKVVDDQHGAPTTSHMLAEATCKVISATLEDSKLEGVYHMTASGQTTWCGFARTIFNVRRSAVFVEPILSNEYPTPARRPRNSLLDNSKLNGIGVRLPNWETGLHDVLARFAT